MFCPNCGKKAEDGAKFCVECGHKFVNNTTPTTSAQNNKHTGTTEFKTLKCSECGGVMQVDEDKNIASCPYCGSASLVVESDYVKVHKQRINSVTGIVQNAINSHRELSKVRMKYAIRIWFVCLGLLLVMAIVGIIIAAATGEFSRERESTRDIPAIESQTNASVVERSTEKETSVESKDNDTSISIPGVADVIGVDPELKAYLDSYEAFVDSYVEFKETADQGDYAEYLAKLADLTSKMQEYNEAIANYDTSNMSTVDSLYFAQVTLRCSQKMLTGNKEDKKEKKKKNE